MPARAPNRNSQLARIHIEAKRLGLDDETYRAMLWTVARVRSAKDLDAGGRQRVLDHLASRSNRKTQRRYPGRPKNIDEGHTARQLGKVEALLADAGRPWDYAHGVAQRMFKVSRVQWLKMDQLRKLIAALEYDAKRRAKQEQKMGDSN